MNRAAILSLHSSPLAPVGRANVGGMQVYVRRLAEELRNLGILVDVFTRRTDSEAPEVQPISDGVRVIQLEGGPARPLPKSVVPLHIPAMTAAFRSFVSRERVRYDILHSHYWISGLVALRCQHEIRAPVIHMFHTLSKVKEMYNGGQDPRDSALRVDGERCVIISADAVVGATAGEREQMERLYGASPLAFSVIPPGVDLDQFAPLDRGASRRALGLDGERIVLFVGRPDRIKGLDTLLHAFADLEPELRREAKLVVVGDPDTEQMTRQGRYQRMARSLVLEDVVEFHGIVPHDQLPVYYSAADLCTIPSAYESFGMVAIEAMACQTPVVAFGVGGPAVTVTDGQTGFLARAGDRSDFTAKLRLALRSHDLVHMGRRARMSVRPYEWSSVVARTVDEYDRVLHESLLCCRASGGC